MNRERANAWFDISVNSQLMWFNCNSVLLLLSIPVWSGWVSSVVCTWFICLWCLGVRLLQFCCEFWWRVIPMWWLRVVFLSVVIAWISVLWIFAWSILIFIIIWSLIYKIWMGTGIKRKFRSAWKLSWIVISILIISTFWSIICFVWNFVNFFDLVIIFDNSDYRVIVV